MSRLSTSTPDPLTADSVPSVATADGQLPADHPDSSAKWRDAFERWRQRFPWAWRLPQSPAETIEDLTRDGFLRAFDRLGGPPGVGRIGRVEARLRLEGETGDAFDALKAGSAVLAAAGDILIDCSAAEAERTPVAEQIEAFVTLLQRRYGRLAHLRFRLGQIEGRRWTPRERRRLFWRVPSVTVECDRAVAEALETNSSPTPSQTASALRRFHLLVARLTGEMSPGACLILAFPKEPAPPGDSRLEGAQDPWEARAQVDSALALPLAINISPAVVPEGLDWDVLRQAFHAVAALSPALVEIWAMAEDEPLRPGPDRRCPVVFSLSGFEKLFEALGTDVGELRARRWVADVFQFARAEITKVLNEFRMALWKAGDQAKDHQALDVEWDYHPEDAGFLQEAGTLSAAAIQTQAAFQKHSAHPLRVGFRFPLDGQPDDILRALSRSALFGAGEIHITVGPATGEAHGGEDRRGGKYAQDPARGEQDLDNPPQPLKPPFPVIVEEKPATFHGLIPPLWETRFDPAGRVFLLGEGLEAGCDRCHHGGMRLTHAYLWCPNCHHVLIGI